MKKRISLIVAMAMLISAFVSFASVASAATDPRVILTATEVDFTDPAYSALAGDTDYDWRVYNEVAAGGEYKTYDVSVALTGLELEVTEKTGKTTKYPGTCLTSASITLTANAGDQEYGEDWTSMISSKLIASATGDATATTLGVSDFNTTAVYPAVKTKMTVNSSDVSPAIFHAYVIVDTGKPVTFTVSYANIVIGTFNTDNSAGAPDSTTEYSSNPAFGTFTLTGDETVTLPLASAPEPVATKIDNAKTEVNLGTAATGLKDRDGNDVTLTKNYGITKFSPTLNTATKNYFICASEEGGSGDSFRQAINFAQKGIEGKASFYVIIKSSAHVIDKIWIEEEDAE